MGSIKDAFDQVFRDFEVDGVLASGLHEPLKSDIRSLATTIELTIGNLGIGAELSVFYATRAELDADLAWDAGSIGLVYADAVDANNDFYVKTGASGAGAWTLTTVLHDSITGVAQPYSDLAQAWAEGTEPGGAGTKSAAEYAADASTEADRAEAAAAAIYTPAQLNTMSAWEKHLGLRGMLVADATARLAGSQVAMVTPLTGPRGVDGAPANFSFDFVNADHYVGGRRFANLDAMLASMDNASRAGNVLTIGPAVLPGQSNLIGNTVFTDTAGWQATAGVVLSALTDTDGNRALKAAITAQASPIVYTRLNLPAGRTNSGILVGMRTRVSAASASIRPGAGTIASATGLATYAGTAHLSTVFQTTTFYPAGHEGDANGGNLYVGVRFTGSPTIDAYISASQLYAYLADPFIGYTQGTSYQTVEFAMPAVAGAGVKTILLLNDGTTRNSINLTVNEATGQLGLVFRGGALLWDGTGQTVAYTLPVVAFGANHTIAFRVMPDGVAVSVNGALPVYITNVSIGGMIKAFVGGDGAGNNFSGTVRAWRGWQGYCPNAFLRWLSSPNAAAQRVVMDGDSYVAILASADGKALADRLATTSGRTTCIIAVGGSEPYQQAGYLAGVPGMLDGFYFDWDGGTGGVGSADQWLAMKQRNLVGLRHGRFLIYPGVPAAPANPAAPSAQETTQRDLAAAEATLVLKNFPGRSRDIVAYLLTLGTGTADDNNCIANGFPPKSLYEADGVHLNAAAQQLVVTNCLWPDIQAVEAAYP